MLMVFKLVLIGTGFAYSVGYLLSLIPISADLKLAAVWGAMAAWAIAMLVGGICLAADRISR
jgi:hypothetical protein